jgi:hypothetical protein
MAAGLASRVLREKRQSRSFIHTKGSVRPVSESHFRLRVRRALTDLPGAVGGKLRAWHLAAISASPDDDRPFIVLTETKLIAYICVPAWTQVDGHTTHTLPK